MFCLFLLEKICDRFFEAKWYTPLTDHDLSSYLSTVYDPRKRGAILDHADRTGPTRQHELDHTDHTDHTRPGIYHLSALKYLDHEVGTICR